MRDNNSLSGQVEAWLAKEGYPLRYYCASTFSSAGLGVTQGTFVNRGSGERPLQIDVVADANKPLGHRFLRVSTVISCELTGDHPLVIFTDPNAQMHPAACIAQTMASQVGDALLWLLRGNQHLQKLPLFSTPEAPGIGGRLAFEGKDDFSAIISEIVTACALKNADADRRYEKADYIQRYGLVTFPVIIVDGDLLECAYNPANNALTVSEVDRTRIHWRGSPDFPLIATVDVVTRKALPQFAEERAQDLRVLGGELADELKLLIDAYGRGDSTIISGDRGPSGRGALPRLLRKLADKPTSAKPNQVPQE